MEVPTPLHAQHATHATGETTFEPNGEAETELQWKNVV